jgi:S1-C subfamily serine protease
MNKEKILGALALIIALSMTGCVSYPAIGMFQDYNEVLYGTVNANLLVGSSDFTMTGKVTGLKCEGSSNVTYIPPMGQCKGQRGDLFATCTDGRSITGQWFAQSCTKGYGRGKDSYGNIFAFTFGMSEQEAEMRLKTQLAVSGRKPDLPNYDPKQTRKEKGFSTGTGFFVSNSGHLVTNFHVIQEAKDIVVRLDGEGQFSATVLAGDSANDVAILKIDAQTVPIRVAAASQISKGSEVMTLGYPLVNIQGQEQKATFGRINSLTGIGNDVRFLQIDVPIQPGNSGGPLISTHGLVVGIVSATLDQVKAFRESGSLPQNVNYAVKADYLLPLLSSVINYAPTNEPTPSRSFEELAKEYERSVVLVIAR